MTTAYDRAEEKTLEELFGNPDDEDRLTQAQFDALPEYSCTLPTGTTIGKKWKRDVNEPGRFHATSRSQWVDLPPVWWTGEFIPDQTPGMVGIRWRRVVICG